MASSNFLRVPRTLRPSCLLQLYPSTAARSSFARPSRFAMMSAFTTPSSPHEPPATPRTNPISEDSTKPIAVVEQAPPLLSADAASPQTAAAPPPAPKPTRQRPTIRSTKVVLTITPKAVGRLRALLSAPTPQLIRIGTRNKGCAGLSYHLEYVEKPGKFDEIVEQDGVKVLVDSKALFSIIGSEMDWTDDALSSKFTFRNPNIEDQCGCGESFKIGG